MASDLGTADVEVHAKAVLDFWFEGLMPEQWFTHSAAVDRQIRDLFGDLRDEVLACRAEGWRDHPDTLLAAVLLLDQFSRNRHRGEAEAYAADPLAQELAETALQLGWDRDMPAERRQFLYMPFQHAEDEGLQALSIACFETLGLEEPLRFAREHRDVILQFGRFPTRNAALRRESTPAERDYLSRPGVGW